MDTANNAAVQFYTHKGANNLNQANAVYFPSNASKPMRPPWENSAGTAFGFIFIMAITMIMGGVIGFRVLPSVLNRLNKLWNRWVSSGYGLLPY